jgi:hypothetical protein
MGLLRAGGEGIGSDADVQGFQMLFPFLLELCRRCVGLDACALLVSPKSSGKALALSSWARAMFHALYDGDILLPGHHQSMA